MVQNESSDQLRIHVRLVLHLHLLDHMEIGSLRASLDGQDGVHHAFCDVIGQLVMELRAQRGPGHVDERLAVNFYLEIGRFEMAKREKTCSRVFSQKIGNVITLWIRTRTFRFVLGTLTECTMQKKRNLELRRSNKEPLTRFIEQKILSSFRTDSALTDCAMW